jgi:hypothetical protein
MAWSKLVVEPLECIDYDSVQQIRVPGFVNGSIAFDNDGEYAYFIDLQKETLVRPSGYAIRAHSVDGGQRWVATKDGVFTSARGRLPTFPRLLNNRNGLTLHISNEALVGGNPPDSATIVEFDPINARPTTPKLAVNYLIAADTTSSTSGQWVLSVKNGTTAVKSGIQIGVAEINFKGRATNNVDALGFGQFYPEEMRGIAIRELPADNRVVRTGFMYRQAPRRDAVSGRWIYTPASRHRRISVTSEQRAPNYRVNPAGKIALRPNTRVWNPATNETITVTNLTPREGRIIDAVDGMRIRMVATPRRAASRVQIIEIG